MEPSVCSVLIHTHRYIDRERDECKCETMTMRCHSKRSKADDAARIANCNKQTKEGEEEREREIDRGKCVGLRPEQGSDGGKRGEGLSTRKRLLQGHVEKKEQEKKNTQISKQNIKGEGGRKIEPRIKEERREQAATFSRGDSNEERPQRGREQTLGGGTDTGQSQFHSYSLFPSLFQF